MDEPTPRRRTPLVAAGRSASPSPSSSQEPASTRSPGRGLWVGLSAGLAVAGAVAALVFAVAAIPLFLFAQIAPDGRDRPEVRTALLVSIYIGAGIGGAIGIAVGIWAGRGGRLPTHHVVGFGDEPE